ncbi:cytochrome P450 [Rhodofomes roseus]|uniref:Cytochrome P450 n=1 Tax=Rhodofomes roseus TaxID=34475 RepID=A0ABQ8KV72_9APHY|nr:cytochrome P450 [Rhodofomes roseus]KAH9842975.1 cytochrome P450 [Rhodofomes roseus]
MLEVNIGAPRKAGLFPWATPLKRLTGDCLNVRAVNMYAVALLAIGVLSAVVYEYVLRPLQLGRKRLPLPPGPPGHWLFGNAPPPPYAYRYYADLTEKYGPVVSLRYGKRIICIVGRYQAATDILIKHSGETMDRPRLIAAFEILSGGLRVVLTPAGDRIKRYRKALHAFLAKDVAENYKPMQTRNAMTYVWDCFTRPEEHMDHSKRYAASIVITLTYGKTTPTSYSDPEVQNINRVARHFGAALRPGAHFVDTYPFLKYIPGYLKHLYRYHEEELVFFHEMIAGVKAKLSRGEASESFVAYLLKEQQNLRVSDNELAYLAGAMFAAGSDTTASALSVVTMAAALHPEAQARVQAQLDKVVGRDRAPTFEDEDMLPEVTAFFMETARWRPQFASGFAHRATKDIIWKDYVIPAGAEVIGAHWAIARDPDVYPDPERFDPQRWLDEDGQLRKDMRYFRFGFGRRVCVGEHLADNSVFINTALMLWAFNITEDPARSIDPDALTDEANVFPQPYAANFTPRVDRLEELLRRDDE